jgi:hypothetical protein
LRLAGNQRHGRLRVGPRRGRLHHLVKVLYPAIDVGHPAAAAGPESTVPGVSIAFVTGGKLAEQVIAILWKEFWRELLIIDFQTLIA